MSNYRAYPLDEDGHTFSGPKTFEAESDIEAIVLAMQLVDGYAMEVWDETRRVGVIERRRSPQA